MGQFVRDQIVRNITVDEAAINEINGILSQRRDTYNAPLIAAMQAKTPAAAAGAAAGGAQAAPQVAPPTFDPKMLVTTSVIRFDRKGYRYFDIKETIRDFRQAETVERLIFTLESLQSRQSNRVQGNYVELWLEPADPSRTTLVASSDDRDWCDAAFTSVSEYLRKIGNRNAIIRNGWTPAFVQLLGVVIIFLLSLWAAARISPRLDIENPFAISLLFVLLLLSNIWTYVSQQILRATDHFFPNVRFARPHKDKMQWLIQALIGGLFTAVALWLIGTMYDLAGTLILSFLK